MLTVMAWTTTDTFSFPAGPRPNVVFKELHYLTIYTFIVVKTERPSAISMSTSTAAAW